MFALCSALNCEAPLSVLLKTLDLNSFSGAAGQD
jgi:hypothetical protein